MTSADWLVPRLSLSAEAEMRHSIQILQREGPDNIDATIRIACDLIQQSTIHQVLLRQATGYITELETELEILRGCARRPVPSRSRSWLHRLFGTGQ